MSQVEHEKRAVTPGSSQLNSLSLQELLEDFQGQHLPAFFWQTHQIYGFKSRGQKVDLSTSDSTLPEVFREVYPELNFAQILLSFKTDVFETIKLSELLKAYGYNFNESLEELTTLFYQLPQEFQKWVNSKSLGPRDLQSLKGLDTQSEDVIKSLKKICELSPSKSLGTQLLNLVCELLQMETPTELILENSKRADFWLDHLKQLRFPVTSKRDSERQKEVSKWATRGQQSFDWVRSGDQTGLKTQMFSKTPEELEKQIETLSKNLERYKELKGKS